MNKQSGSVTFIDRALSDSLLMELKEFTYKTEKVRSNVISWDTDVVNASSAILLQDIEGDLKEKLLTEIEAITDIDDFWSHEIYTYYALGTRGSFLGWHDDSNHVYALTIYMNEHWDRNYGGAFLYEENDEIKAVFPEFNKACFLKSPVHHGTTMLNYSAPIRQSVQIFLNKAEVSSDNSG